MARGNSGRIVIEIDPDLKKDLYLELAKTGKTLKEWFIECAESYMVHSQQPELFVVDKLPSYSKGEK